MDKIESLFKIEKEMKDEHEAWIEMFNFMSKVFVLNKNELNKKKYKKLFELIEKWAYYDRVRRKAIIKIEGKEKYPFGLFWKGE